MRTFKLLVTVTIILVFSFNVCYGQYKKKVTSSSTGIYTKSEEKSSPSAPTSSGSQSYKSDQGSDYFGVVTNTLLNMKTKKTTPAKTVYKGKKPDLVIKDLHTETVFIDDKYQMKFTAYIKNIGTAAGKVGDLHVMIFSDEMRSPVGRSFSDARDIQLLPGDAYPYEGLISIQRYYDEGNFSPGNEYYVDSIADISDKNDELREDNNQFTGTWVFEIPLKPMSTEDITEGVKPEPFEEERVMRQKADTAANDKPDLIIEELNTTTVSLEDGYNIYFEAVIKNIGKTTCKVGELFLVFLDDGMLGRGAHFTRDRFVTLAPNETHTYTGVMCVDPYYRMGHITPGNEYRLFGEADISYMVDEADEENNKLETVWLFQPPEGSSEKGELLPIPPGILELFKPDFVIAALQLDNRLEDDGHKIVVNAVIRNIGTGYGRDGEMKVEIIRPDGEPLAYSFSVDELASLGPGQTLNFSGTIPIEDWYREGELTYGYRYPVRAEIDMPSVNVEINEDNNLIRGSWYFAIFNGESLNGRPVIFVQNEDIDTTEEKPDLIVSAMIIGLDELKGGERRLSVQMFIENIGNAPGRIGNIKITIFGNEGSEIPYFINDYSSVVLESSGTASEVCAIALAYIPLDALFVDGSIDVDEEYNVKVEVDFFGEVDEINDENNALDGEALFTEGEDRGYFF